MNLPLLTISWLLPLIGALLLLLVGNADGRRNGLIRWLALGISLVAFAVTLAIWASFNAGSADFQITAPVRLSSFSSVASAPPGAMIKASPSIKGDSA